MAALIKHESLLRGLKLSINVGNLAKYSAQPPKKEKPKKKPGPQMFLGAQRIIAKGYLRPQRPYEPPEDIDEQLERIFHSCLGNNVNTTTGIEDPSIKFELLYKCCTELDHGVPNSLLHTINCLADIVDFYKTPVVTDSPIERYKKMDLPPNLHIQYEPKRFDAQDDAVFGGVSAFPESPTLVTGLKAKKKYKSTEPQRWSKDWRKFSLGYIEW